MLTPSFHLFHMCRSRHHHLVPLYFTSFPHFFSVSMRTSTSLSDSIQTSFLGRSISNFTSESEGKRRALLFIARERQRRGYAARMAALVTHWIVQRIDSTQETLILILVMFYFWLQCSCKVNNFTVSITCMDWWDLRVNRIWKEMFHLNVSFIGTSFPFYCCSSDHGTDVN